MKVLQVKNPRKEELQVKKLPEEAENSKGAEVRTASIIESALRSSSARYLAPSALEIS